MLKSNKISADEILTPFKLRCGVCGKEATAYPRPGTAGLVFCENCSNLDPNKYPKWMQSFAQFATDCERIRVGCKPLFHKEGEIDPSFLSSPK